MTIEHSLVFSWMQHGHHVRVTQPRHISNKSEPLQMAEDLRSLAYLIEETWDKHEIRHAEESAKEIRQKTYKFLAPAEKLQPGDEYWYDDEKKWLPVRLFFVTVQATDLIRREVIK